MRTIILKYFLLLLSLSLFSFNLHAKISLSVDRSQIRANETFQLVLNVEQASSLQALNNIDFLPPEFITYNNQQFQKSVMVNGKFTNQMGWSLGVMAREAGTYTIPSFTLGNEQSQPFNLRILPSLNDLDNISSSSKIKIKARIDSEDIYVQQQLIFSVRVYSSVLTRRRNLTPLQVNNAVVEKISDSVEFQTVHEGVTYNVLEDQYVIFPQKSGDMQIEPITYSSNIIDNNSNFGSLNRYRPISLSTQRFSVKVKPQPATAEQPWLPAKALQITANWQPEKPDFTVGSPATLDFIIKGVALLPNQLPIIEFPEVDGLKIYRDKVNQQTRINAQGVISYHLEKIAVIPNKQGQVTIPAIKVPYWNTDTNQQEYATLTAKTININAAPEQLSLPTVSQPQTNNLTNMTQTDKVDDKSYLWQWLAFILTVLWLSTLALYLFSKRSSNKKKQPIEPARSFKENTNKVSLQTIKQACLADDPKLTSSLLLTWCNQQQSLKDINNLDQLAAKFTHHKELNQQLQKLQSAIYNRQQDDWRGSELAFLLPKLKQSTPQKQTVEGLPELYS